MNTSNVRPNGDEHGSDTLSLRAAAQLAGVAPSTLSKHKKRLLEAGAKQNGQRGGWQITRDQLEQAGFPVEQRGRSREQPETHQETPRDTGPDWAELWRAERERANKAEAALIEERRRVDSLTGALMMAVRQLEQSPRNDPEPPRPEAEPVINVTTTTEPKPPQTDASGAKPRGWRRWFGR